MDLGDCIKTISIPFRSKIRDALKAIDMTGLGVAFVVDDGGSMVGLLTDGDLRQALLGGHGLESEIGPIARRDFISATIQDSSEAISKLLNEKIHVIPILDDRRRVVNIAFYDRRILLPITSPYFGEAELKYVVDCVVSGWVSSSGSYVKRFEELLAKFIGVDFAISTSSGTTALHLALAALDIKPGDEVIVPTLTFAATVNAVLYTGATPVFVDSEEESWNINPAEIEAAITPRTKAIIVVHLYGHPANMSPIMDLAKERGLYVVEDAAEACGAKFKDVAVSSIGDLGCFSFYGNKIITTGEGGAIITNHGELAEKIKLLRDHGMSTTRRYWHEVIGYNYRMTNLQAAVGTAQMEAVEHIIMRKAEIAQTYDAGFRNQRCLTLPPRAAWATPVCWLYTVLLKSGEAAITRDQFMGLLKQKGIETRPMFYPIHTMPPYRRYVARPLPVAERLSEMGVSFPSSVSLRTHEIEFVISQVNDILTG